MQTSLFTPARPTEEDWLSVVRRYLLDRAEMNGEVTMDDIWHGLETGLLPPLPEVFKNEPRHLARVWDRDVFQASDRMKFSDRKENHHRRITVWTIRG